MKIHNIFSFYLQWKANVFFFKFSAAVNIHFMFYKKASHQLSVPVTYQSGNSQLWSSTYHLCLIVFSWKVKILTDTAVEFQQQFGS